MFYRRTGDFTAALQHAKSCSAIAQTVEDPVAIALARAILGTSLHLSGDLADARAELEAALDRGTRSQRTTTIYLGFKGQILAGAILARNLWLQGHRVQAMERARQTVEEAAGMDHSLTLAIALIWAISVFLWTGDLRRAETYIDWLLSLAESHSLAPSLLVGRGFKGEMAIRQGDAKGGVDGLQSSLRKLHAAPYELLNKEFNLSLSWGFSAIARFAEAIALIDETMRLVEANGDLLYMPEVLRMRGSILLSMPQPSVDEAEACFMQSLELSRRQGARAWELRTAVDLAKQWVAQGRFEDARALLQPVFEQFTERPDTADLESCRTAVGDLGLV